jgi:FkbM family methyltransferase
MKDIIWQSEEGNDRWVAEIFKFKRNGYFVEGGATAGRNNSAIVLEKQFGWNGIAVNANRHHARVIKTKQRRKNVERAALWSSTGIVEFYETPIGVVADTKLTFLGVPQDLSYSSFVVGSNTTNKEVADIIEKGKKVKIPSITLERLLKKYKAPPVIDYIGLDIEGSEYEVLRVFPFNKYKILAMSIEMSEPCLQLLTDNGFTRVVNPYCPKPYEHHYVNNEILEDYPFEVYKEVNNDSQK